MAENPTPQTLLDLYRRLTPEQRTDFIGFVASESSADLFGAFWNALPMQERHPFMRPLLLHVVSVLRPILIRETIPVVRAFPDLSDDEMVSEVSAAYENSLTEIEAGLMLREESKFKKQRDPKPRFEERDDEIVRLRDELLPEGKQRSFGQIALLLESQYPGLTSAAAGRAYNRVKTKKKK